MNTTLDDLLRAGVQLDPLYPTVQFGPLTDHLPMALTALAELGGDDRQLAAFRAVYAGKLVPVRATVPFTLEGDGWRAALGEYRAYGAWRTFFERELAARGRADVLATWVPRLIDAMAAHAIHAMIRLAAALHHGVNAELAAALAYWCSCYIAVPAPRGERLSCSLADAFARARAMPELGGTPLRAQGFEARLLELAGRPAFVAASAWRPTDATLSDLARESARIYLGTGDFFAMHMVTGSHALRVVRAHVALDDAAVLDRWWQALVGAYVVIGAPDYARWRDATEANVLPDAAVVLRAAEAGFASDDPDHVVKLLWSACEEHRTYGHAEHARIVQRVCARFASDPPA